MWSVAAFENAAWLESDLRPAFVGPRRWPTGELIEVRTPAAEKPYVSDIDAEELVLGCVVSRGVHGAQDLSRPSVGEVLGFG